MPFEGSQFTALAKATPFIPFHIWALWQAQGPLSTYSSGPQCHLMALVHQAESLLLALL